MGAAGAVTASSQAGRSGSGTHAAGFSWASSARRPAASALRRKVLSDMRTPESSASRPAPSAKEPAATAARWSRPASAGVMPSASPSAFLSGKASSAPPARGKPPFLRSLRPFSAARSRARRACLVMRSGAGP